MCCAENPNTVQELAAQRADEPLADRVLPRSLDGGAHDRGAGSLEDGVQRGGEVRAVRRCLGSSRVKAAITARSAQSGLGRVTWRRRTVTSCRRTRISTSLEASLRARSASQPDTRTMSR